MIGDRRYRDSCSNTIYFFCSIFNKCYPFFPYLPFLFMIKIDIPVNSCIHSENLFFIHLHAAADIPAPRRRIQAGSFDKILMPVSIFISNFPAFGMAIILLVIFAVGENKPFPTSGGYGFDLIPNFSWEFIWSVIVHYQLPFWSIVLIAIGGQAIGMRSMSIYELNADYVKYSRFLGIKDRKIVGYVFRNAMLPQITGLALSVGTMVGGALVAEIVFSYPGLGSTILTAVKGQDYPLISATTLIVTVMVLLANFIIEILYGFVDPRIKAAQSD